MTQLSFIWIALALLFGEEARVHWLETPQEVTICHRAADRLMACMDDYCGSERGFTNPVCTGLATLQQLAYRPDCTAQMVAEAERMLSQSCEELVLPYRVHEME